MSEMKKLLMLVAGVGGLVYSPILCAIVIAIPRIFELGVFGDTLEGLACMGICLFGIFLPMFISFILAAFNYDGAKIQQ